MVIATSGTTGRPKGVCQSQRSIRFLMDSGLLQMDSGGELRSKGNKKSRR